MWLMIIPGVVAVVAGVVMLCAPQWLLRDKPSPSKGWIVTDAWCLEHRMLAGICLIVVGTFCLLSAFYVWLRLTLR